MLPIRVLFKKIGSARYISHLDLQRAVVRALSRSGVAAAFTEGFNPHLKIVFSMPLSVYQESECEFFDIRLEGDSELSDVYARLSEVFPEIGRAHV